MQRIRGKPLEVLLHTSFAGSLLPCRTDLALYRLMSISGIVPLILTQLQQGHRTCDTGVRGKRVCILDVSRCFSSAMTSTAASAIGTLPSPTLHRRRVFGIF